MSKRRTLGLIVGLSALAMASVARSNDPHSVEGITKALGAAKITAVQAIEAAQKEITGGKVTEVALHTEKEAVLYEVNVLIGEGVKKVRIDAASGKVLGVEGEPADEAKQGELAEVKQALGMARLTFPEAIEAAAKEVPDGRAFNIKLELKGKQAVYMVALLQGDKAIMAPVNASSGEVSAILQLPPGGDPRGPADSAWRRDFKVDKANWADRGKNPYFLLEPGHRCTYKHGSETLSITVLDETKVVDGVTTRVVEEREEKNGKPKEISRNYFAMDKSTNDVYYFGEDVDIYKDGKVVGHGGAWLSGVNGAKFGLMMPGRPKVGDKFYQEVAPKVAMDRAEIVGVHEPLTTPAGDFRCLHVKETTPLEKDVSHKWYVAGLGLVKDDEFVIASQEPGGQKDGAQSKEPGEKEDEED